MSIYSPRVSVVIPVFNGANFVGEAIESALHQTYPPHEVIVVDDGSTDCGATLRAIDPYRRWVKYLHQPNGGVASALNAGIRAMSGDWFSWLSHDDIFLPDKTERQIEFLRRNGLRDVILYSDYECVDRDKSHLYNIVLNAGMLAEKPLLAIIRGSTNGCTMLVPEIAFRTVGQFDERLRFTQDYDFWNRAEDLFPLVHCPGITVRQRLHSDQDSHKLGALTEGNALWLNLADSRSDLKQSLIDGSPRKFLQGLRKFVAETPYAEALAGLDERIATCSERTLVSVILDVGDKKEDFQRSYSSLRRQTHRSIELIVVDRTNGDWLVRELRDCAGDFDSISVLRAWGEERSEAWGRAAITARGTYVVFSVSGDMHTPTRIQTQVELMQETGVFVSHTSYFLSCPLAPTSLILIPNGGMSGRIFPQIVERCPVRIETAMFNRALLAKRNWVRSSAPHDEALFLIELAAEFEFAAISEPQCILQLADDDSFFDIEALINSLAHVTVAVRKDPLIGREEASCRALEQRYLDLSELYRSFLLAESPEAYRAYALRALTSAGGEQVRFDRFGFFDLSGLRLP